MVACRVPPSPLAGQSALLKSEARLGNKPFLKVLSLAAGIQNRLVARLVSSSLPPSRLPVGIGAILEFHLTKDLVAGMLHLANSFPSPSREIGLRYFVQIQLKFP